MGEQDRGRGGGGGGGAEGSVRTPPSQSGGSLPLPGRGLPCRGVPNPHPCTPSSSWWSRGGSNVPTCGGTPGGGVSRCAMVHRREARGEAEMDLTCRGPPVAGPCARPAQGARPATLPCLFLWWCTTAVHPGIPAVPVCRPGGAWGVALRRHSRCPLPNHGTPAQLYYARVHGARVYRSHPGYCTCASRA